jgi:hypothetical protein
MRSGSEPALVDLLVHIRNKGVRLWSDNGQLRYKAPRDALTHEEIDSLRAARNEIVAFLEGIAHLADAQRKWLPRTQVNPVPLAFSQQEYWELYQPGKESAKRGIVSATRIHGPLDIEVLDRSISEVVRRHEALRTRIVESNAVLMQDVVSSSHDTRLGIEDLTHLAPELREAEVQRVINALILEPIDFSVGPLFGARIARLYEGDHVLVLAMEHMISDAFSRNVLLREVLLAYQQAASRRPFSLPPVAAQFPDYALWQHNAASAWKRTHGPQWHAHFAASEPTLFPQAKSSSSESRAGLGSVPLRLHKELKQELSEWCRARRTTLPMTIFTVYVALVLRWCANSQVIIRYQSDGRAHPDLQNAIGYFASVLYLRIAQLPSDTFLDLMEQVTREYCSGYEHADFSYLITRGLNAQIMRNPAFNWVPHGANSDHATARRIEHPLACSPFPFEHPLRNSVEVDSEPWVLFYESEQEISGNVYFPLKRFSIEAMERFTCNFLMLIRAMLDRPTERLRNIRLL